MQYSRLVMYGGRATMTAFLFEPLLQTIFLNRQIRHIMLLFSIYPLSLVLRYVLHPSHTPLFLRYTFSLTAGLLLALICFGQKQVRIIFAIIIMSYLLLIFLPPTVTQRYSMVWAFMSLSATRIYLITRDYSGSLLNFTGPLMVMVEKITYVAYALHDGRARQLSDLSMDQKEQKIDSPPSLLVYLSYMFNFNTLLAGPTCTFRQYLSFIDGSNLHSPNPLAENNMEETQSEPSMWFPVLSKMAGGLLCHYLFVNLSVYIDKTSLEPLLPHSHSLSNRLLLNFIISLRFRTFCYSIWLLAESINNCAGLGFSGYDMQGQPQWNLMSNLLILDIEFGPNLHTCINGWNTLTSLWLRRCVYERTVVMPTCLTIVISVLWHGSYPGYFCTVYFAIAIIACRKIHRLVRPCFQSNQALKVVYFVLTLIMTVLFRDFGFYCGYLLFLNNSIVLWSYYYYIPIITMCVVAFVPLMKKKVTMTNIITIIPADTNTREY